MEDKDKELKRLSLIFQTVAFNLFFIDFLNCFLSQNSKQQSCIASNNMDHLLGHLNLLLISYLTLYFEPALQMLTSLYISNLWTSNSVEASRFCKAACQLFPFLILPVLRTESNLTDVKI